MSAKHLKVFIAVTAVVLLTGISAHAAETTAVRYVSGEITWIDTRLGVLQLNGDESPDTGKITEYRISEHETRVTNPSDKTFLTIGDLQPGQHVTMDVVNGQEEKIVQEITTSPRPASDFQEAYGEIESIDEAGTFTLAGRPRAGETGESSPSFFVFEPEEIVVMQSPSRQAVQLVLKPGDVVRVEYVVRDGKRVANSITLYPPKVMRTTTTTTVTTTQ